MNWKDKWSAISARIEGLMKAGELYLMSAGSNSSDTYGVVKNAITPQLQRIIYDLSKFNDDYGHEVPPMARLALDDFLKHKWDEKNDKFLKAIVPFQAFRAEFDYYLKDIEGELKTLTELAFEHLRRLIAVSPDIQQAWLKVFEEGETSCERLGAVHLLSHGIWAFKVSAQGGATDLVYQDSFQNHIKAAGRTARGLVLTEWKKVKVKEVLQKKAEEAREQTNLYKTGVLGGVELTGTRYVVLVCEKDLPALEDIVENNVRFRHIIIPLKPDTPSVAARKKVQR